ncbi:MAG: ATP synthase F0 subunit C [Chloroflexi bacterium]|nr:ATP synthase F0 subunit C [Chloroflexota bacterium]
MNEWDPQVLITFFTILISGIGIVLGTIVPTIMQGRAVQKALDGIARQPEAANDIRTTLLIAMALLESAAIYVLLVILVLLFANPLIDRFF